MKTVILCGLPMSGKSSLGVLLAKTIGSTHFDSDALIEQAYYTKTQCELSCRQIYLKEGQEYFRHLESEIVTSLKDKKNSVISLGGGTLMQSCNVQAIKEAGFLIYLQEDPLTIWKRLSTRSLPAFLDVADPKNQFLRIAEERHRVFVKQADQIILLKKRPLKAVIKELINGL